MMTKVLNLFAIVAIALNLAGCGGNDPASTESAANDAPPPADQSEGVVRADTGRIAAELIATPGKIQPDGRVRINVVNHGARALEFGRSFTVEKWDGESWVETRESLNAMWTMDLLFVEPGTTGEEQTWPFLPGQRPDPGWYRISQRVSADPPDPDGNPISLTIRTRVEVRE
ncbi:MAG: hypothetical protein JJU00_06325 [Opitutales bacterium]|nr:hypothetical protein [Opitutales bacterium]